MNDVTQNASDGGAVLSSTAPAPISHKKASGKKRGRPPTRGIRAAASSASPVRTAGTGREPVQEPLRRRRPGSVDNLYIPSEVIPRNWTYEWKTLSVLGEHRTSHQIQLHENGWRPVPASRHPEMMPPGFKGDTIVRDGLVLMERPASLTQEAKTEDYGNAVEAVRIRETQMGLTPKGEMDRLAPKISKSFEPVDPRAFPAD